MSIAQIETTAIWTDVRDVMDSTNKKVSYLYKAMVHTVKEDVPVLKIMEIDIVRDYANNIGDHIEITFQMSMGDYALRLFQFRENLEVTIKKTPVYEAADRKDKDTKVLAERYKAVFLADKNPSYALSDLERMDLATLNNMSVLTIKLQLLNRSLEPLRIKSTFGVFRNTTPKKLIQSLLVGESMRVSVDGKPAVDGLDLVEPDNTEERSHVVIPNGSLIVNLPTFIQERMGGVYTSGIGTYLQMYNDLLLWFVYPLFDVNRFKTSKSDKLIVYALPEERYSGIERTFKKDGSIVHVLATKTKKYKDDADVKEMNTGSGFSNFDPRTLMKKPVEITADGPKAIRGNINSEVVASARGDGLNYAPVSKENKTSNYFKEYSRVNARALSRVDFVWENSDDTLLYPGMPCKYCFMDNNKLVELKGTLVHVHSYTSVVGVASTSEVYKTVSAITMLLEIKPLTRDTKPSIESGVF